MSPHIGCEIILESKGCGCSLEPCLPRNTTQVCGNTCHFAYNFRKITAAQPLLPVCIDTFVNHQKHLLWFWVCKMVGRWVSHRLLLASHNTTPMEGSGQYNTELQSYTSIDPATWILAYCIYISMKWNAYMLQHSVLLKHRQKTKWTVSSTGYAMKIHIAVETKRKFLGSDKENFLKYC